MMMDQRAYERAELDIMVNKSLLVSTPVANVSENGICFNTNKFFEAGDFLVLEFALPGNIAIKAFGKVKWQRQEPEGMYVNGLEFWHLEDEDRIKLKDFTRNRLLSRNSVPD